jgi:sortase A
MKKKKNRSTTVLLLAVLLAGLVLLLYPSFSDYWNSFRQSRVISNYAEELTHLDDNRYQELLEKAYEYNRQLISRPNEYLLSEEQKQQYDIKYQQRPLRPFYFIH